MDHDRWHGPTHEPNRRLVSPPSRPTAPATATLVDAPLDLIEAQRSAFDWLVAHRRLIIDAENVWRVPRLAIAGAIAWEAIENPNYVIPKLIGCCRGVGPGKVHYKSKYVFGEGLPVAKQIEVAGYLPPQTIASRKRLLRSPEGAIQYIGAIMCAYADIGAQCGFPDLRTRRDLILTQPYHGVRRIGPLTELDSWRGALLQHKERGTSLRPENPMYTWVNVRRNREFLEAAVGHCGDIVFDDAEAS
ncbi:MAG TPA: hypothetical protein VGH89_02170 [Pseudonocardia sp.]|jgi:hypothetical protein